MCGEKKTLTAPLEKHNLFRSAVQKRPRGQNLRDVLPLPAIIQRQALGKKKNENRYLGRSEKRHIESGDWPAPVERKTRV